MFKLNWRRSSRERRESLRKAISKLRLSWFTRKERRQAEELIPLHLVPEDASDLLLLIAPEPFECFICFDDVSVGSGVIPQNCGHAICKGCVRNYIHAEMDNSRFEFPCMFGECGQALTEDELEGILGTKQYQRMDRLRMEQVVGSTPNLRFCPSPDCNFIYAIDPNNDDPMATFIDCPVCLQRHCYNCPSNPFHSGVTCEEAQYSHGLTRVLTKHKIRVCKGCGNGIQKAEGCNKMECRCGYRFCFACEVENATCNCTPMNHIFTSNAV